MAIKVNNIIVIDDSRNITNVSELSSNSNFNVNLPVDRNFNLNLSGTGIFNVPTNVVSSKISGSNSASGTLTITSTNNTTKGSIILGQTGDLIRFGNTTTNSAVFTTSNNGTLTFGTLPVDSGGTGNSTIPTNGQLLIGNGSGYTLSTLTSGANITITNTSGKVTISANADGITPVLQNTIQDSTFYPVFAISESGNFIDAYVSATRLSFNPMSGKLSAVHFVSTSDENKKYDIKKVSGIDVINKIDGVIFKYKDTNELSSGVIAQNVEKVIPHAVFTDSEGTKSVAYNQIIAYLIEGMKEQQKQIELLQQLICNKE